MARTREAPVHQEGVIPQEFAVDQMKSVRDGEKVRVWCYTVLVDPLSGRGTSQVVPVVVLNLSAKAFDTFVADGIAKVVAQMTTNSGGAPT